MITNGGRVWLLKAVSRGNTRLSAVAIGNGGVDATSIPIVPIAAAPQTTTLEKQIYFEERIQVLDVITPKDGSQPRLLIQHTFENSLIPPTGTEVKFISEFGVFGKDPDTGLYVLVAYKTFDPATFRIPATGSAVIRDSKTIKLELF